MSGSTDTSDMTVEGSRRNVSRGSYGMTEMTGDATVPEGKTTWGDGLAAKKDASEAGDDIDMENDLAEEDSPFAEVRASVSNIDDPDMPALTARAMVIGMFFAVIGSGINTFFFFRFPAPYISPLLIQVASYPVGKAASWIIPIHTVYMPGWLGGWKFSTNPGPFNIKEHTIIVIMANISVAPAYALFALSSLEFYYQHPVTSAFGIFMIMTTQMTGFAFAGFARRFVVWPASMIWPGNLVIATNLNTFHAEEDGFKGGMTRLKFLLIAGSASFGYYFLPGYLFTALSNFSWPCWIAPRNIVINQLFGVATGLGMGLFTFDWSQIAWISSPLTTPWWAAANIGIGFILFYWILVPILYYTNVWQFAYLPMSVSAAGDRYGMEYNVSYILTPETELNRTAYGEYSPVYLSATFSMTFMLAFALSTALIVHTILYHGPRIYRTARNMRTEVEDIHLKLMKKYPDVPEWWYLILFVIVFVIAVINIEVNHTDLPVYGYLLSVLLPLVYLLPAAFIYAMTNQTVATNLLSELIPGYLFQGKPIPGMIFKTFSVQSLYEALYFISDQKLGHYMKIPPRSTFVAQLTAGFVSCFVQFGTYRLVFSKVPDICTPDQPALLTCSSTQVFYTSSILWGAIGPQRLFSKGSLYHPQLYAFLVGAILPIPMWFLVRKYPKSLWRNINIPVIFNGALSIPPATGVNYASWLIVSFIFQFWLRRKKFAWWSKYNYVLSAALDVGTTASTMLLFLAFGVGKVKLDWWGNNVFAKTADWNGESLRPTPPDGFGPTTWKT
ncbi:hypothetical protein TREMEDRAFT_42014 [Tremella mesenterica DSM 1558]|uniref:uncharacterized protein n=1 Tax=Tremella mesenterica (strain ATCC 24925 / CBS 8224 / DSM 1558 / NBRC 9311 / NRRL Y-6157 / RJB 2259-6 / UBC 559-6) TaxID=578456 RepID=UPI0003F49E49|nr:uncharacterized protein TREMEDRAFT_42014 [Tremella mesenterica DSM 1558]EIW72833.1 hypothetical protein TREMEDRAFT_42014 [Tremella mesenterica DSM 1558]